MGNEFKAFGMRGWRCDSPAKSGFYIVKAFKHPPVTMRVLDDVDSPEDSWNIEYPNSIVIKSYFNGEFADIPDNFFVVEWLDETPVLLLNEDEISDEFGEAWYVDKQNPFKRAKFLKLLNSCSEEQAKRDKEKIIEESKRYNREQEEKYKTKSDNKFKIPSKTSEF